MKSEKSEAHNVLSLLKEDHKRVQKIFKEFKKTQDESTKKELVEIACNELTIHTQIEEELLYPAARKAINDDKLLDEAGIEHQSAKQLINTLQKMQPGQDKYDATFSVLGEYVTHHIKEEEDEIFPKLKKARLDLVALGKQVMERKRELKTEMGLSA